MKRVIAAILLFALLFVSASCMSAEEREARKEALNALSGASDGAYALSTGTTIQNQNLYDDGGIIIQLAGIQGPPTQPVLVLAVKNGSRRDIALDVDQLSINGWQVDGWCDLYQVESHSITIGTIECGGDLSLCGITDVGQVDLEFSISDADTYEDLAAVCTTVFTSAADSLDPSYLPDGITLLEESDFLVRAVSLASLPYGGTSLCLYLENNSCLELSLESSRARLNGQPVELWFWDSTAPGCRRMMTEYLYDEDTYDDILLEPGDVLTFDLSLCDWDTGAVLATQSVSLSPEDF